MLKKIVIKLGGSSLQNPATLQELVTLVKGYHQTGYGVVVVHGGGPAINLELVKRGIEWKFIHGQRQTTPAMMSVIEEVLGNEINSMIVAKLFRSGLISFGLSGANEKILQCAPSEPELIQVGKIMHVNTHPLEKHLPNAVPVVAPIGVGMDGTKYNINADWAATQIAIALNAEALIFLTDQNGILDQRKKIIVKADSRRLRRLIADGTIHGGMMTKTLAMMAALNEGVGEVRVVNATVASRVLIDENLGTVLTEARKQPRKHSQQGRKHEYAS